MADRTLTCEEQLVHEIHQTPPEYWPLLLQLVRLFRHSIILKPAEVSFQQGWQEAVAGQTRPVSELWEGLDAE